MNIINLTPHTVTIIRRCPDPNGPPDAIIEHRTEYPACAPSDLPRAIEARVEGVGDMCLTDSASDGQGGYENACSLKSTGLVDFTGYTGVEGLPAVSESDRMFGLVTFRIVSIVTVLGALAAGRGIEDLLVPMGQVRDAAGRIIGATALAPASSLLTPMYGAIVAPYQQRILDTLRERNEARVDRQLQIVKDDAVRALLDALAMPSGRCVRKAWDSATLMYGRFGNVMQSAAFGAYIDEMSSDVSETPRVSAGDAT